MFKAKRAIRKKRTDCKKSTFPGCPVSGFVLPAIDDDVPVTGSGASRRTRILARLALLANGYGWNLPNESINDASRVFGRQLNHYIDKTYPFLGASLVSNISVYVDDSYLQIWIEPESRLDIYLLEPVITPLEAAHKGLGWFVAKTLCHQQGLFVYDESIITQGMCNQVYWEMADDAPFTDQEYAKAIRDCWGESVIEEHGEVTEAEIQRLKDEYEGCIWPSEIVEVTGGNVHLAGRGRYPSVPQKEAALWLGDNADHPLAKVVEDALNVVNQSAQSTNEFDWDINLDECERFGAMAFVLWTKGDRVMTAVQEHEETIMNGGSCAEAISRYVLPISKTEPTDDQLKQVLVAIHNYLDRWHLTEKLISNFPTWDGEQ